MYQVCAARKRSPQPPQISLCFPDLISLCHLSCLSPTPLSHVSLHLSLLLCLLVSFSPCLATSISPSCPLPPAILSFSLLSPNKPLTLDLLHEPTKGTPPFVRIFILLTVTYFGDSRKQEIWLLQLLSTKRKTKEKETCLRGSDWVRSP